MQRDAAMYTLRSLNGLYMGCFYNLCVRRLWKKLSSHDSFFFGEALRQRDCVRLAARVYFDDLDRRAWQPAGLLPAVIDEDSLHGLVLDDDDHVDDVGAGHVDVRFFSHAERQSISIQ